MALPTEQRPLRMDPDLAKQVDGILKKYKGDDLEKAHQGVMKVYHSGQSGGFHEIVERYREAIEEAVA